MLITVMFYVLSFTVFVVAGFSTVTTFQKNTITEKAKAEFYIQKDQFYNSIDNWINNAISVSIYRATPAADHNTLSVNLANNNKDNQHNKMVILAKDTNQTHNFEGCTHSNIITIAETEKGITVHNQRYGKLTPTASTCTNLDTVIKDVSLQSFSTLKRLDIYPIKEVCAQPALTGIATTCWQVNKMYDFIVTSELRGSSLLLVNKSKRSVYVGKNTTTYTQP